jgi:hypothetical protein
MNSQMTLVGLVVMGVGCGAWELGLENAAMHEASG